MSKNKTSSEDISSSTIASEINSLSQFRLDNKQLRLALVEAQYRLRETRQQGQPTGLLVLVNGMEMSNKGVAVTQLRQWVDPRLLKVEATIGQLSANSEPLWQPHTQHLPRHGSVMVYFGNWYADLICDVLAILRPQSVDTSHARPVQPCPSRTTWSECLLKHLDKLSDFERDLQHNNTKLLKCWFHTTAETLRHRLDDDHQDPTWLYHLDWQDEQALADFNQVANQILSQQSDWVIIDGNDTERATLTFCHQVLQSMQQAIAHSQATDANDSNASVADCHAKGAISEVFELAKIPPVLQDIDNTPIAKSSYKQQLKDKQTKLAELLRARGDRHVVFTFEGVDAAGKGGAIKRLVAPLDPREYQIYNISAPTQRELEHPYLWRFWTRLPEEQLERLSRVAIFDRTWYGRVLVERIEGFATETEWQRAYEEINRFESDLVSEGTILLKYWLAIDKDEQLERFEDRQNTPHKRFKLTEDDWRNRDKWQDYVQAAADMLARTDTHSAPWHIVADNNKRIARLNVLDHAITQLMAALN